MALSRLNEKLTKENLWIYILSMLKSGPMYGYEISAKLRDNFHVNAALITTYVVLYRMEREKLIQRQKNNDKSGRIRKVYYSITENGKITFEKGIEILENTLNILRGF